MLFNHTSSARGIVAVLIFMCSLSVNASSVSAQPLGVISQADSLFLRNVQRQAFNFFWNESNPLNGLIKDRSTASSASSIASVGFGLSSICVAADYGWVTRAAAAERVRTTLRTFWYGPQGSATTGMIGRLGFFYHFLNMSTAVRDGQTELSSIDTGLLIAGILHCQQYFDAADTSEQEIRALADSIYRRMDFEAMRHYGTTLNMGWLPETGWLNAWWVGYCEAMILYVEAFGSPTHPVEADLWNGWTGGYDFGTYYGYTYVIFPPLFGHQYSHCWIDFRGIRDDKMSGYGLDYFENSRRATLAQRAYCAANPGNFPAYSDSMWGITASDAPNGYSARGAPPAQDDDGTLVPTAPGGSVPFAPQECIQALKTMYNHYCIGSQTGLWGPYGFRDAFNVKSNWFDSDYIGIDEGPIVLMIENFFTQRVWDVFMKSPYIQTGLQRAGFKTVNGVGPAKSVPGHYGLQQNFPNPFNPATMIRYELPESREVTLTVFDLLGRVVAILAEGRKSAGMHEERFDSQSLPSGVYYYKLHAGEVNLVRQMVLIK